MGKIIRGIWWLLGLGVCGQYLYWIVCMVGWRLGKLDWPTIDGVWTFIAVGSALMFSVERTFPQLRDFT